MKRIFPFIFCLLFAQDIYEGPIMFTYSGSENGDFNTVADDSTNLGGAFNFSADDSSSFIMMGVSTQAENEFDLFVCVLQDTSFPVEERNWDIPGNLDPEDPLSSEALLIFIPGLDSTFVTPWLDFFTDTTNISDSLGFDSLTTAFFTDLLDDMYIGIDGNMEISGVTDSTVTGNFNCSLWKPLFSIINIDSAEFHFSRFALPALANTNQVVLPKYLHLDPAYPNPFNPTTTIQFSVETHRNASLQIFDITGRLVETLVDGQIGSGFHEIKWDASGMTSGVYFIQLQNGNQLKNQKLLLLK